ncbi:MAG: hypothetical protein QOD99_2572, partial [Chthoniobacter sp.]|nr:hypothetical protein [Chthoniobacter sp.]
MRRLFLSLLFFAGVVALWHSLVLAKIWSPVLLPDPKNVGEYLWSA